MTTLPSVIGSKPGIQRDGTLLETDAYADGIWARWPDGVPRKMGGYIAANKYLVGLTRTLHNFTQDLTNYIHAGSYNHVERMTMDTGLATSVISDRTPTAAGGFVSDPRNLWQFDAIYQSAGATPGMKVVAQVAPNLDCICNSEGGALFYGDLFGTAKLTKITLPATHSATGGVLALGAYLVVFGTDGFVGWSKPGDPTDWTGDGANWAWVASQKILRGLPLRGGPGASPSALLWSADSLLRMAFTGTVGGGFSFDTISTQTSVLSTQGIIEYDGIYYWAATDRFLMFNGVVREIPNAYNSDFFFNNVNHLWRQKVFSFAVPRFGEIWWCFPFGDSTEPNHAVIYNTRTGVWYDTPLPNGGRSAAVSPAVFRSPMLTGVELWTDPKAVPVLKGYRLWVHERGFDEVEGTAVVPILSTFETGPITLALSQKPSDNALQALMLEPDFVQNGPMTVQVLGQRNARAPDVAGPVMTFPDTPATPAEAVVFLKEQRRQLRLRFESNVVGGYYRMGRPLLHSGPGDGTVL